MHKTQSIIGIHNKKKTFPESNQRQKYSGIETQLKPMRTEFCSDERTMKVSERKGTNEDFDRRKRCTLQQCLTNTCADDKVKRLFFLFHTKKCQKQRNA